jgi:hypothetical protein
MISGGFLGAVTRALRTRWVKAVVNGFPFPALENLDERQSSIMNFGQDESPKTKQS